MAILESLIGAGASLIGSIFGGGSKKQTTSNTVNYKALVRSAEAAGFNPLTALRNGGAAGFTTSTTGATPFASRLADGLAGATQSFLQSYNPMEDKAQEMGYQVMQAQLANLQADTAQKLKFGQVPTVSAPPRQRAPMGTGLPHGKTYKSVSDVVPALSPVAESDLEIKKPEVQKPQRTNPYPSWTGMEVNPWQPDMSAWEDHLGDSEIGSTVGLGLQLGQDVVWNGYRVVRAGHRYARDEGAKYPAPQARPYRPSGGYIPPALQSAARRRKQTGRWGSW